MDEWDLAIEKYEGLRRYREENYGWYLILAWCYVCKGQPDKAREVLEDYLATIADNALIRGTLGDIYCIQGDFEKAKKETDKAYVQAPEANIYSKHFYLMCTEDFAALEPVIKQMEASPLVGSWIGFGSAPLALQGKLKDARTSCDNWLEEWQGKIDSRTLGAMSLDFALFLEKTDDFAGALAACETALRNAKETGDIWGECVALYCRGVMQARQGNIKDSQESAEELRRAVESGPAKKRIRFYEALLGVIALQKHDAQSAQDHLKKALSLTAIQERAYSAAIGGLRSSFLDYLAEACSQAGEWPEAKKAYEDVLSCMMTRGDGPSSALVLARAYYKLGKVLEHLGDKANAAAKYRKFLDLWKNADPGLPEVEDAKKRLAALS